MRFDDEVTINAAASNVWRTYADVERWPEWTASVRSVRYEHGDTLESGARVRIEQPKLPKAAWEVTQVEPGRSWTWVSRAPGIRTTAIHTVEPINEQTTRVQQTLVQDGPLGAIFGRIYGKLTRRYLATEAAGLKRRCEA
jgi:uncharacterized membrane protein